MSKDERKQTRINESLRGTKPSDVKPPTESDFPGKSSQGRKPQTTKPTISTESKPVPKKEK